MIAAQSLSTPFGWKFERRGFAALRSAVVKAPYDEAQVNFAVVQRRLNELTSLSLGWDGYRGKPVNRDIAAFASFVITTICGSVLPLPQIIPGTSGDLQLEWHTLRGDLELRVVRPNVVEGWFCESHDEDGVDKAFTTDFKLASTWLTVLMEDHLAAEPAAA